MPRLTGVSRVGPALLAITAGLVVGAPVPPASAVDGDNCTSVQSTDTVADTAPEELSQPMEQLQIAEAQAAARTLGGREPGAGVGVAVVDNGVLDTRVPEVDELRPTGFTRGPGLSYYHGTAVAGVIAGEGRAGRDGDVIGVAPAAEIYDVRVYDDDGGDEELEPLTGDGLVAGLQKVRSLVPDQVQIVNVSLSVADPSPELEDAVRALTRAGAIVVASSGNRPTDPQPGDDVGPYEFGEDAAAHFWPAGLAKDDPLVVAVGTTTDPAAENLDQPVGVLSSAIDVVVPSYGAVTWGINGSPCSLYASSTSIAAAEVSGVLALLRSAYPGDTVRQTVARLEGTTTGGGRNDRAPDTALGRGVVQPLNALTSPIRPDRRGELGAGPIDDQVVAPAVLPEPEPDVLASTRRHALWWGLAGGGALVIALLLRPVLSRRR